jgi:hypothetical protein
MKKVSLLFLFILPVLAGSVFTGCKKYEDGPALSLRTKKARVSNTWRIEQVFETASGGSKVDKTDDYRTYYVNYVMNITKEGNYTISYRPLNISDYNEAGAWEFGADKNNLIFINSNGNSSTIGNVWEIHRLKEKELWMSTYGNNGTVIEAHLIPN